MIYEKLMIKDELISALTTHLLAQEVDATREKVILALESILEEDVEGAIRILEREEKPAPHSLLDRLIRDLKLREKR